MTRFIASLLCICGLALTCACATRQPLELGRQPTIGDAAPPANTPAPARTPVGPEVPAEDSRHEAIEQYRAVLATETDGALRSEVARRTAELEVARGGGGGIALYEELLKTHPDAPDNDRVLYQLARAYDSAGRAQDSQKTLGRLLRDHPSSPLAIEARFRRAERWFSEGRYQEAEKDYLILSDDPAAQTYADHSQHKLGWCALKSQRPAIALERFLKVLDRHVNADALDSNGSALAAQIQPAERELLDDTLRGSSLALALSEGPAAAGRSRSPARSYEALLYRRFGEFFMERGDAAAAAQTYQAFLGKNPGHPAAARFQLLAAQALNAAGDKTGALRAQEALLQYYREPVSAPTSDALSADEQVQLYTQVLRKRHAQAQSSKSAADYVAAAESYRLALQRFPERNDWRYLYAELLFESGDNPRAATEYEQLAYQTPAFAQAEAAGYAAVLARQKAIRTGDPASVTAFAEGVNRFLDRFPQHPERAALLAEAARQAFSQRQFPAALALAQRARGIAGISPAIERSVLIVSAQSQMELGQLVEVQSSADAWFKLATPQDAQFGAMRELRARAAYRQAEQLRIADPAGDSAIAAFLHLRELAPNDLADTAGRIRASAEYDAAAMLIEQKRWLQASNVMVALRQSFPQHPQRVEISRRLALAYRELGHASQAAAELSILAKESGDPELARVAAYDTAELRRRAGDSAGAVAAYAEYVKRYPRPLRPALEARTQLAALEAARGQRQAQARWLKEITAQAKGQTDPRVRTLGAQAALALADQAREQFMSTPLKSPLTSSLPRKRQHLQAALNAYEEARSYGIAETSIAAGFHIGELPALLAQALTQAPVPAELDASQRQAYTELLHTQAAQLRSQSVTAHQRSLNQATAAGLLEDPWAKRSVDALIALGAPPAGIVSSEEQKAPSRVADPAATTEPVHAP